MKELPHSLECVSVPFKYHPADCLLNSGHIENVIVVLMGRLAPIVSAFCFLPVAVFVSLIPFNYFATEALSFPLRDITYQIIISCTRLYTFEKKRENYRKR